MQSEPGNQFKIFRNDKGELRFDVRGEVKIPAFIFGMVLVLAILLPPIGTVALLGFIGYYIFTLFIRFISSLDHLTRKSTSKEISLDQRSAYDQDYLAHLAQNLGRAPEIVRDYGSEHSSKELRRELPYFQWSKKFTLRHQTQRDQKLPTPIDENFSVEGKDGEFIGEFGVLAIQDRDTFGLEFWLFDKEDFVRTYMVFVRLVPGTFIPRQYTENFDYFSGTRHFHLDSDYISADIVLGEIEWVKPWALRDQQPNEMQFKSLPIEVVITPIKREESK